MCFQQTIRSQYLVSWPDESIEVQAEEATSSNTVELPTRLNNIPHQRDTRKFFYKDVTDAVLAAVKAQEKRISVRQGPLLCMPLSIAVGNLFSIFSF